MTPADKARELLAAASPGPWRAIREDETSGTITMAILPRNEGATVAWVPEDCNDQYRQDAALIAAAPDLIRDLLADVERLERERDGLREALNTLHTWADGFENPRSGMGSGLHAEMYPTLSPSARRYLLQMTRDSLTKGPTDGRDG